MKMTFKQYLKNTKRQNLSEEVVTGGLFKMFKHLEFWFDKSPADTAQRIEKIKQAMVNAGGARKFAMVVRRIPSVRNFLLRHKDELEGDLLELVNLI